MLRKAIFTALLLTPFLIFFYGEARASTLHVPGDFKTIQEAVNSAMPGDAVMVGDGRYAENLVIQKPVTVKSKNGPSTTVITAKANTEPVIKVFDTYEAAISGFTVTGSKVSGILVSNSSRTTVKNNMSLENGNGIILYHSKDNSVIENNANSNESYGIYLEASSGNILDRNTANMNRDKGFFISYSNNNKVTGNSANMNTWNGMTVWSSHNNLFKDNMTLRNTFGIVLSDSRGNELEGNTTLPNIFIILPIVLIYLGIISYLIQKNLLRLIYRV